MYKEQIEFTRRQHFKTIKGRSEAVWPPHLCAILAFLHDGSAHGSVREAVLIQGKLAALSP